MSYSMDFLKKNNFDKNNWIICLKIFEQIIER